MAAHGKAILTTEQMRMAERYSIGNHGLSVTELMQRAGQAVAQACNKHMSDSGRVVIVAGKGNNAGDGFAAACLLRQQQIPVTVIPLLALEGVSAEVERQIARARSAGVKIRPAYHEQDLPKLEAWLSRAVLVVDAIFGTGLKRPVTGWLATAMSAINQASRPVLAVDIASGIDADSGAQLAMAIRADVTLPIAAYKWGHWLQQGGEYSGKVLPPASIGISRATIANTFANQVLANSQLISRQILQKALPTRPYQAFKQTFGHVWVLGGSVGYTGAPKLAAMGAQAVAAGLVSIACPDDVYAILASASLEVMVHPQSTAVWHGADAIVAGPGWGKSQQGCLLGVLQSKVISVLDADALNMLAEDKVLATALRQREGLTVLTPHAGEAARLLDTNSAEVQKDRLASAMALVEKYHAWVVLKGANTLIASPDKEVWVNPFGSVNLARAGTGDVLAGAIAGMLATTVQPELAVPAAVALHGMAGEKTGWYQAGQLADLIASEVEYIRAM